MATAGNMATVGKIAVLSRGVEGTIFRISLATCSRMRFFDLRGFLNSCRRLAKCSLGF